MVNSECLRCGSPSPASGNGPSLTCGMNASLGNLRAKLHLAASRRPFAELQSVTFAPMHYQSAVLGGGLRSRSSVVPFIDLSASRDALSPHKV